jgi:uncharacterized repeat protein (TIGR02543 family)
VSKNPDLAAYNYGTSVTLTAIPTTGYTFTSWTGDTTSSTNPLTITMYKKNSITANFTINKYNVVLTANPQNGGTVSGSGIYDHGSNVSVKAIPKTITGSIFQFSNWTENGNVVSSDSNYSFIIAENRDLVANFLNITSVKDGNGIPTKFNLSQNYPNPFNPTTTIDYSVPKTSFVILKVYDALGKEVTTLINEEESTGNYTTEFDASNLSSGIYFYQIRTNEFIQTNKMMLMK